jgi:hypothetical protein
MTTNMDREVLIDIVQSYLIKANTNIDENIIKEALLKAKAIIIKLCEVYEK